MSLRNQSRFVMDKDSLPSIWNTLLRIQNTLNLTDKTMADHMNLTAKDFLKLKLNRKDPKLNSTMTLTKVINVGFDSLLTNKIDYTALSKQYFGDKYYMPEKYLTGANSKRRTVVNLLDYVEDNLGWEWRLQILRRFQMTEAMFENQDAAINLRLSVDIGDYLLEYYKSPALLVNMGKNAVNTHKNSAMGTELKKARNLPELFEMMCEYVLEKYIEKNFKWSIRFHDDMNCSIDGIPNRELIPILGKNYINSHVGCLVRTGFMSSIPGYLGFPDIALKKTKCVSKGDGMCRFELDFLPVLRRSKQINMFCN